MAKNKNVSIESQEEAARIANGTQKKGQTKEQTKLITAGIEKGIAQYKKQHKAKMREQDKLRKKHNKPSATQQEEATPEITQQNQVNKLPWILLIISWLIFLGYFLAK